MLANSVSLVLVTVPCDVKCNVNDRREKFNASLGSFIILSHENFEYSSYLALFLYICTYTDLKNNNQILMTTEVKNKVYLCIYIFFINKSIAKIPLRLKTTSTCFKSRN